MLEQQSVFISIKTVSLRLAEKQVECIMKPLGNVFLVDATIILSVQVVQERSDFHTRVETNYNLYKILLLLSPEIIIKYNSKQEQACQRQMRIIVPCNGRKQHI